MRKALGMTRLIAIVGIMSFLAAVGLSIYAFVAASRADDVVPPVVGLTVSPEQFDLGTLLQHTQTPASFTLTNNTNRPIHIARIAKSCACSEPTLSTHDLPPGGTATLTVLFKSQMRVGTFNVPLQVLHVDPVDQNIVKVLQISVIGRVKPEIEQSAPSFSFDEGVKTVTVTLHPGSEPLPRLIAVSCSHDKVRVKLEKDSIIAERLDPFLKFDGSDYVLVETDQPMMKWLRIPLVSLMPKTDPKPDAKKESVNPF
jgi:hypothetical protein